MEDLIHLPIEKLSEIRNVCGCHFTDDNFANPSKKRLKNTAVPSVFDPRIVPLSDELMANFLPTEVLKIPTEGEVFCA